MQQKKIHRDGKCTERICAERETTYTKSVSIEIQKYREYK